MTNASKIFIKNRKDQKICVVVETNDHPKGLAFVIHGLSGNKDQPHIRAFIEAFLAKNFTVVSFDTTNTFGESDGQYEDATVTNYYSDLEDVIAWATTKSWYQEPFVLVGSSLGGMCTALYAEKYPNKVKALAPTSTVISARLSLETPSYENYEKWKASGWIEKPSLSKPGFIKRLKWSHMEDRRQYDILIQASKLTMPVLLMTGEEDDTAPVKHQKIFLEALPGPKELHIILGAPHTFVDPIHLQQAKEIFLRWIDTLH